MPASVARRSSGFRFAAALALVAVVGVAGFLALAWRPPIEPVAAQPRDRFDAATIARGARLAAVGNCTGCHSLPAAAPFAGGVPLGSAFGTVYATNITPDPVHGIGAWSRAAFDRAMREGVSRDGHLLYPAFPFDHFTRLSDTDLGDLYAYVMTRTPASDTPPPNTMRFPFGFRPLLAGWDLLFLKKVGVEPDTARSAEWNRGAYLANGLAHCTACHSPRNALGAERRDEPFAGGQPEGWYAPPLNADSPSPKIWTTAALAQYLRTGIAPGHAMAGGPMQGVTAELSQASASDVDALATYVVSLMGDPTAERRQREASASARAEHALAPPPDAGDARWALGSQVYATACAGCHDLGRRLSSDAALRLPLAVAVYDADPRSLLRIVREGIHPPDGIAGRVMPAFGTSLSDAQLSALAAYLRHAAADAPPWPDLPRVVQETNGPSTKDPS